MQYPIFRNRAEKSGRLELPVWYLFLITVFFGGSTTRRIHFGEGIDDISEELMGNMKR